jgi:hypothetical protein
LSLKVFQLAKELQIDSKDVVKKLLGEGIPPPLEKGKAGRPWTHMSPVSAGLEATIREWFASGELKTAVETTQHVDAAKIHKAPRKRGGKKTAEGGAEAGGHDSATAVAEPPSIEEITEAPPADETISEPLMETPPERPLVTEEPKVAEAPVTAPAPVAEAPTEPTAEVTPAPASAPPASPAPLAPTVPSSPPAPPVPQAAPPVQAETPVTPIPAAAPVATLPAPAEV